MRYSIVALHSAARTHARWKMKPCALGFSISKKVHALIANKSMVRKSRKRLCVARFDIICSSWPCSLSQHTLASTYFSHNTPIKSTFPPLFYRLALIVWVFCIVLSCFTTPLANIIILLAFLSCFLVFALPCLTDTLSDNNTLLVVVLLTSLSFFGVSGSTTRAFSHQSSSHPAASLRTGASMAPRSVLMLQQQLKGKYRVFAAACTGRQLHVSMLHCSSICKRFATL
jgi:hypothetical protein